MAVYTTNGRDEWCVEKVIHWQLFGRHFFLAMFFSGAAFVMNSSVCVCKYSSSRWVWRFRERQLEMKEFTIKRKCGSKKPPWKKKVIKCQEQRLEFLFSAAVSVYWKWKWDNLFLLKRKQNLTKHLQFDSVLSPRAQPLSWSHNPNQCRSSVFI